MATEGFDVPTSLVIMEEQLVPEIEIVRNRCEFVSSVRYRPVLRQDQDTRMTRLDCPCDAPAGPGEVQQFEVTSVVCDENEILFRSVEQHELVRRSRIESVSDSERKVPDVAKSVL